MNNSKKENRLRRARKTRGRINLLGENRLCVYKTPRHIYAQVIAPGGAKVVTSASTLDKDLRKKIKYGGNVAAADHSGTCQKGRGYESGF